MSERQSSRGTTPTREPFELPSKYEWHDFKALEVKCVDCGVVLNTTETSVHQCNSEVEPKVPTCGVCGACLTREDIENSEDIDDERAPLCPNCKASYVD